LSTNCHGGKASEMLDDVIETELLPRPNPFMPSFIASSTPADVGHVQVLSLLGSASGKAPSLAPPWFGPVQQQLNRMEASLAMMSVIY
jgi:hypothetical protein